MDEVSFTVDDTAQPITKPPDKPDTMYRCPDHPEMPVTAHVAVPTGGYRRACPLCPVPDLTALAAQCNEVRLERWGDAYEQWK